MVRNSIISHPKKYLVMGSLFLMIFGLECCSHKEAEQQNQRPTGNESQALANWLAQNGNYIASDEVPALISADELFLLRDSNVLILDLRTSEQFISGSIEGAINLPADQVAGYISSRIDPPSFSKIVFVDNRGQLSSYVASLMRLLGYDNVFSLRFGMSSWNTVFAAEGWNKVIGNDLVGKTDFTNHPKRPKGPLWPTLNTGATQPAEIARLRVEKLLSVEEPSFLIGYKEVLKAGDSMYLINYWPEDQYLEVGHLQGAIQYSPRIAWQPGEDLLSLPVDQPIVLYCYNGQHAAHAVAYLRMLGYDARSIIYGSNAFIHSALQGERFVPANAWGEVHQHNFPVVSGASAPATQHSTEIKAAKGGC